MNLFLIVISYFIGTLPFAFIAGYFLRHIDIRELGDRNAGASNISRHVSPTAGLVVLIADIGKGFIVILMAKSLSTETVALWCGLAVVAGHNWPIFFKFRGGRGLSTSIGIMFALVTVPMIIVSVAGLLTLLKSRNLVLTGFVMWIPLVVLEWHFGISSLLIIYSLALPCLSGIMHLVTTRNLSTAQKKEALYW